MIAITRVTEKNASFLENIWNLYENTFPPEQRRTWEEHMSALQEETFHSDIIQRDGNVIGLIFYWVFDDYIYVEHLCITENHRRKGYGIQILEKYKQLGKKIILEIEPAKNRQSEYILKFYKSLGFVHNNIEHTGVCYKQGCICPRLQIMSYPSECSGREYREFYRFIKTTVEKYTEIYVE